MSFYADYEYYAASYYGEAIAADDYPRFASRASDYIDYITQGRAAALSPDAPEYPAIQKACCALAEKYQTIDSAGSLARQCLAGATLESGSEMQSETVGSWSKTYRSGGESAQAAMNAMRNSEQALADTARMYLARTGLLYRGGGRYE